MAHVPHVPHVPEQVANPIEAEAVLERLHRLLKRGRELGRKHFRILADCLPDLRAHICTHTNANPQCDAQRSFPRKDSRLFVRSIRQRFQRSADHSGTARRLWTAAPNGTPIRSKSASDKWPISAAAEAEAKAKDFMLHLVLRLLLRLLCGRAHRKRVALCIAQLQLWL
jgi:hypothetical protein